MLAASGGDRLEARLVGSLPVSLALLVLSTAAAVPSGHVRRPAMHGQTSSGRRLPCHAHPSLAPAQVCRHRDPKHVQAALPYDRAPSLLRGVALFLARCVRHVRGAEVTTAALTHKRDQPPPSGRVLAQGHQRTSAPLPCDVRPSTLRRAARAVEPVAERRGSLHSQPTCSQ